MFRFGRSSLIILIAVLAPNGSIVRADVIHVDVGAKGANDGTRWSNAYTDLQTAFMSASAKDEIWVAEGTYRPAPRGGDRHISFELVKDVVYYGGFPSGGGDGTFGARDPVSFITILSGDLNGDDGPDGENIADNVYHVLHSATSVTSSTIFDGFTVIGGNAEGPGVDEQRGGGMYIEFSEPGISNCVFEANRAVIGASIYSSGPVMVNESVFRNHQEGSAISDYGFPTGMTVTNCDFLNNENGCILGSSATTTTIVRCSFTANGTPGRCTGAGPAVGGDALIINSVFSNNYSCEPTGASISVGSFTTTLTVVDSIFRNTNSYGAEISVGNGTVNIINCTFLGGYLGLVLGTDSEGQGQANVWNSVFWDYEWDGIVVWFSWIGTQSINYSTVENWDGSLGGIGNNGLDPMFVDPDGADGIPGTEDDDLRLMPGSPAIDSGDNNALPADDLDLDGDGDLSELIPFDFDGLARFVDDPATKDTGVPSKDFPELPIVDRGAYEFQPPCEGDANGDTLVDHLDAGFVLARFDCAVGKGDPLCDAADVDKNGLVDPLDAGYVLARFGECP